MKIITSNLAIHIVTIEERKKKVWGIRSRHEKEVHVNTDFLLLFYFFFNFIFSPLIFILYVIVKYQKFKHF